MDFPSTWGVIRTSKTPVVSPLWICNAPPSHQDIPGCASGRSTNQQCLRYILTYYRQAVAHSPTETLRWLQQALARGDPSGETGSGVSMTISGVAISLWPRHSSMRSVGSRRAKVWVKAGWLSRALSSKRWSPREVWDGQWKPRRPRVDYNCLLYYMYHVSC